MSPRTGPCRKGRARHVRICHRQESPGGDGGAYGMRWAAGQGAAAALRTAPADLRTSFIPVVEFLRQAPRTAPPRGDRDAGGRVGTADAWPAAPPSRRPGTRPSTACCRASPGTGRLSFGFPSNAGDLWGRLWQRRTHAPASPPCPPPRRDAVRAALLGTPTAAARRRCPAWASRNSPCSTSPRSPAAPISAWPNPAGRPPPGPICPAAASAGMSGSAPPMQARSSTTATRSSATTPTVTVLHELGHALGLKHAHEAGGVAGTAVPPRRTRSNSPS